MTCAHGLTSWELLNSAASFTPAGEVEGYTVVTDYQNMQRSWWTISYRSSRESTADEELGWWLPHCELPQLAGCVEG